MSDYLLLFTITSTLKDGTKQYKNGWDGSKLKKN